MPTKKKTARKRPTKAERDAAEAKKKKRGRPRIEIDWDQVAEMGRIHCTAQEISAILGIDQDGLARTCKRDQGKKFSEYLEEKRGEGRQSLRRRQYQTAMSEDMKGSATMQIWLGKQWLGQSDKVEQKTEGTTAQIVTIEMPDNGRDRSKE